jgi:2-hydroxychromene-2-carboxylate isomerase
MADLDFYFDPICPWAWITSRWVVEVQQQRSYDVSWKFIALRFVNEDKNYETDFPAGYPEIHGAGLNGIRVAAAARAEGGNDAVARVYTELGLSIHNRQEREAMQKDTHGHMVALLSKAGLNSAWADAVDTTTYDDVIRAETKEALERTGKDVGTPIITFNPGSSREASFFGPVISVIPRGDEATRLWDAIEVIATSSGMAELKRSIREYPKFD